MYNPETVKTELFGLWGWKQNHNTNDFTIASNLTTSTSGQYYQEIHALLTLNNIRHAAPSFDYIDYANWDEGETYQEGQIVSVGSTNFRAKRESTGVDPSVSGGGTADLDWGVYDAFSNAFSEWLEDKTKGSIAKVIRNFWTGHVAQEVVSHVLESKFLFDATGRQTDTITGSDKLVGFEITPARARGVVSRIDKIGLHFTGTEDVTVYLLHSSQKQPVKTKTFTRTKDSSMEWFVLEEPWELTYDDDSHGTGGSWSLAYDQTGMTEKAINTNKDWSKKPDGFDGGEYQDTLSRYVEVHPFSTSDFTSGSVTMWDISKNVYSYTTNYGLNLSISTVCDFTSTIKDQKDIFQNMVGLQVAIDLLEEFVYNAEGKIISSLEQLSKMDIMYALDGDSQSYKKSGLRFELKKAMEAAQVDLTKVSRICTRCKKRGVKHKVT